MNKRLKERFEKNKGFYQKKNEEVEINHQKFKRSKNRKEIEDFIKTGKID